MPREMGGAAGLAAKKLWILSTVSLQGLPGLLPGWGLLSVAVAEVEPEQAGAQSRPWFSITSHYRKLEIRTNRASPSGAPRKRNRRTVTGSEQNREAAHRWSGTLSGVAPHSATVSASGGVLLFVPWDVGSVA